MNLSAEQLIVLRLLAADEDLAYGMEDLRRSGLSDHLIKQALQGLIALGLVQHFFLLSTEGIELMKGQ